ncbi:PH domain-containing protein [Xylanimonas allomyrinae]|uniref:PH domain-containing protein n=1 Tax=Xylanimonas allomyrinae TaxID=2509459 RepID=UPI0013A68502|nr:PH domain-containing protein [Xylanimonas allomyrinae]
MPGVDDEEDDDAPSPSDLCPLATVPEALLLAGLTLPGAGHDGTDAIAAALSGRDLAECGFLVAPRRARALAPVGWRHAGVRVTPAIVVVRSGRWRRRVTVLGHEHPQAVTIRQGWRARRRRLATVTFALPDGPGGTTRVRHVDDVAAWALFNAQARRAC